MRQYRTYNFYTPKGNRLTIVGEQVEDNKIDVIIIPCSKKDFFSKKKGIELYNEIKSGSNKKTSCTFATISGDSPKDFIRWCRGKYKRLTSYAITGNIHKVYKPLHKLNTGFSTYIEVLV